LCRIFQSVPPIIPDYVPDHFPAGTTVKYTRTLDDFPPSDGWAYTIYLNGLTQTFSKAAVPQNPTTYLVEFVPSDTASLTPGAYRYAERLTRAAINFVITSVSGPDGNENATYLFSSVSGPTPRSGDLVAIAGFVNSGNNASGAIQNLTANSFTITNPAAVAETHAATGTVASESYDIRGDELVINIEPNAATSAPGSFVTWEEKTLAIVEAALSGRLTSDIESYQIAGRAVNKIPIQELKKLRGELRAAVWRQQNPGQLGVAYKVQFDTTDEDTEYPPTWQDVTGLEGIP
jgi:hypothetical protein